MHDYLHSTYDPTFNRSSAMQCFECSDVNEIHNGIIDFYMGTVMSHGWTKPCVADRSSVGGSAEGRRW